jgi:GH24 family phage-related lysozyme (muramidase)
MFEALIPILREFEGNVPHMYLDTRGYVTVGVGHLLASVQDAYGLPFLLPTGLDANPHSIFNDYSAVKQSEPGRTPRYYAAIADLRLTQVSVDNLLISDITAISKGVEAHLPQLPGFPEPAQYALLNMAFQLGPAGLAHYQRLMVACREQDWKRCAVECAIRGAQPARNEANKNFFLSI